MTFLFAFLLYFISVFIFYGFIFAYAQGRWPLIAKDEYRKDRFFSIYFAFVWPIFWLVAFLKGDSLFQYGWRLK